ncbi:hypothetical protein AJ79_04793 [Helicocarpus griseus UAMH5409]|uniref:Uncharacterized protein n=1 Tax=Helicocarpus griseus UAMH5409 TaxID=1447875 RepID=A0A2B7XQQ3_9EURO|nr:hypothetical protein AJ79_04793 [Helicocarpus griseus UAMH5409]
MSSCQQLRGSSRLIRYPSHIEALFCGQATPRPSFIKPPVTGPGNWYVGKARVGGETVTVQSQSILDDQDLQQLCDGNFPANCEGEEIRLGGLSRTNFDRIKRAFEARIQDELPVRGYVTYNAAFSTTTVLRAPPPTRIHLAAINGVERQIMAAMERALPSTFRDSFSFLIQARSPAFDSEDEEGWSKSRTESSSMKLWLDGNQNVKVALLIKFDETPQYRAPVDVTERSGEVLIHGKVFVNRTTGYYELWGRNPSTGKPEIQRKRKAFYDSAGPVVMKQPELELDFDTFFPNLRELRGSNPKIDWPAIAMRLELGHKRTATDRYLELLHRYRYESSKKT